MRTEKNLGENTEAEPQEASEKTFVVKKPDASSVKKLFRSAVLGMALTFGGGEGKTESAQLDERPAAASVEKNSKTGAEKNVAKVKKGLEKLMASDDSEKRWLAESAMQQIEAHEELAEKITEKLGADQLPPPWYLKAMLPGPELDGLDVKARQEFDSFRIDKKGKETKEFRETSIKDRFKKFRQIQSSCAYDYFIKNEGVPMANLRVLVANKFYHKDQEEMAIEALKQIADMEAGKDIETPDKYKWIEEEREILKKLNEEREKTKKIESSPENAKAIKDLLDSIIEPEK